MLKILLIVYLIGALISLGYYSYVLYNVVSSGVLDTLEKTNWSKLNTLVIFAKSIVASLLWPIVLPIYLIALI